MNIAQALRRIPKWLKITITTIIILTIVIYCAVGWYFSSQLFSSNKPQEIEYDQTITAISGKEYTMQGSAYDVDGIISGIRNDKSTIGFFSAPKNPDKNTKTSTRTIDNVSGTTPAVGEKISLQGNMWITNPKDALGYDYQDVKYQAPLGQMSAWQIPGQSNKKWVIGVHGIGADKNEMLRFMIPVHQAGYTSLVINYRGDRNNPASPDGHTHYGDTEWQDLEAAVRYAKQQGATETVLYGSSLGGSITENYLRRSHDVAITNIPKVILDSPALDWNEILSDRVKDKGLPGFLAKPGMQCAKWRSGIDFKRLTTKPGSIQQPTLIIHNHDDTSVPQAASKRVAAAQPDRVTFVDFGTGGHIRAWNHDHERYEQLVKDYLEK